jgi:hypothetical protein
VNSTDETRNEPCTGYDLSELISIIPFTLSSMGGPQRELCRHIPLTEAELAARAEFKVRWVALHEEGEAAGWTDSGPDGDVWVRRQDYREEWYDNPDYETKGSK